MGMTLAIAMLRNSDIGARCQNPFYFDRLGMLKNLLSRMYDTTMNCFKQSSDPYANYNDGGLLNFQQSEASNF